MNCPNCGAPMRLDNGEDHLICEYCASQLFPEKNRDGVRILAEGSALACPVCAIPLAEAAMNRHRIFYFTRCHGSLIPMATFTHLVQDLRAQQGNRWEVPPRADPQQFRRTISCPRCHRPMDTHYYGGPGNIIIDDCSPCELNWLDSGKLMRVVRAPEHFSPRGNGP